MYHPLKNDIHSSQAAVSFDGALNSKYYIIQSVSQSVSPRPVFSGTIIIIPEDEAPPTKGDKSRALD